MTEITIPKSEYDSLLSYKTKAETLQNENTSLNEQVKSLKEETANKKIAIDEARDKLDDYKKEAKKELDSEKARSKSIIEKLWVEEWHDIFSKIDELTSNNSKYSDILANQQKEITDKINSYKELLWEEFVTEKASLLEGLDDVKQEIFLRDYVELKGLWDKDETPKVWVHNNWDTTPKWNTNFDKLVSSWASASDLINSLD